MSTLAPHPELQSQLARIQTLQASGQALQAEMGSLKLLERWPDCVPALVVVARCAADREDHARAAKYWRKALDHQAGDEGLLFRWTLALASDGDLAAAEAALQDRLRTQAQLAPESWLLLGHVKQHLGQPLLALKAWFRAIDQAQREGRWLNEATTAPELLQMVLSAMQALAKGKHDLLMGSLEGSRQAFGSAALTRVDRAVANYLRLSADGPSDPRQRPKFLYIPGLPDAPYHDPFLQPWARRLSDAYELIRDEAIGLLDKDGVFESFLQFGPNANRADYVSGAGVKPSWDAFFFYRHGQRFDDNHQRCPGTSQVLEDIELCRIKAQAPEVCFSLLAPGSHIMAHYGVTNSRLVMHLPLRIPADCALNVIDAGPHHWQEGRLMMFDDTFQHEAWNRSEEQRLILLMDCWNPHLSAAEKAAITQLVECISDFEREF